jgi:hypothetical protein
MEQDCRTKIWSLFSVIDKPVDDLSTNMMGEKAKTSKYAKKVVSEEISFPTPETILWKAAETTSPRG